MKRNLVWLCKACLVAISIGAITSCSTSVSGDRAFAADGRAIHEPGELEQFVLEEPVNIRGLGTRAALEKLDRAYREACRKAGEVPLELSYEVPSGYEQPLNFTSAISFDQAVNEIAASSKLALTRRGSTYRFRAFQVPRTSDRLVQKTYRVPPDFLARMSRDAHDPRLPIRVALEKRGVSLDETTKLTLWPGNSTLGVETRDPSDDAAISAMIEILIGSTPKQIRWDVLTIEVPPGQTWNGPGEGIIDAEELADLRRVPGVREQVLLGGQYWYSTLRSNQPRLDPLPGGTLRSKAALLGFGLHVNADLKQKSRGSRPVSISIEGQTPDGGTRIATSTRPDGSRVVLAVTPTIIDATGRPLNQVRR